MNKRHDWESLVAFFLDAIHEGFLIRYCNES